MKPKIPDEKKSPNGKLRIPFGVKLTAIVTLILLGSIWIITSLMALMVGTEFIRTAEETNFAINNRAASGIRERLYQIRSDALLLLDLDAGLRNNRPLQIQSRTMFFERNPNIAGIIIPGKQDLVNRSFIIHNEISPEALQAWITKENAAVERAKAGEPVLRNAAPEFGIYLLAFFYPWQNSGVEEAAVIFFSPQSLSEITGPGSNTTVVSNEEGDILVSPDFDQVLRGENISTHTLFARLWNDTGESVRLNYTERGKRYVGAGHLIPLANAAVFSSLEYSIITEQVTAVTRRNILLAVTVMFLSILVTWFYSRMITVPLKRLIAAAGQIEQGNFNPDLKVKSGDEVGTLTERFLTMGQGLGRWENTRNLVGRFENPEIMNDVMAGKINLSGENLPAVVLSATMVSFYDTAGEADRLTHLNFLFSKLADSIEKTGGVVDKIFGNKLIALWGIPSSSEGIDSNVMNCLHSVTALRTSLWDINTEQAKEDKPSYRINFGIHTGNVLAGRMGSSRFYQYTVAGETIDQAMKAGAACIDSKIDIVITEAVRDLAGSRILAEELEFNGQLKSDSRLFGLVNLTPSQDNEKQRWPFTLKDVQESLRGRTH